MIGRRLLVIAAAITVLAVSGPSRAQTLGEIKERIEGDYGVDVLGMRRVVRGGRKLVAVSIMSPGGNFNDAYQINVLLVDPDTGRPIPLFRHDVSGYRFGDAAKGDTTRERTKRVRLPGMKRSIRVRAPANGKDAPDGGEDEGDIDLRPATDAFSPLE